MKDYVYSLIAVGVLGLAGCSQTPTFRVHGVVDGAEGKTIYLEASSLEGVIPLDSVTLRASGDFDFSHAKPEAPEFYRLRIEDKVVNFAVDSTETQTFKASYADFSTGYQVEGSEDSKKIKELTLCQLRLQEQVNSLIKAAREGKVGNALFEDSLKNMLQSYKDSVKVNYIYAAPNKIYAYYALFQEVNGLLLFDPYNDRADVKCFAAVATSMNNAYPHADRSRNLYNMVIKGMKNTRPARQTSSGEVVEVNESGIIDIELKDIKGNVRKLSELSGKVVLLDFTAYQTQVSVPHNFMIRELYDKYASKGFEVYQVSFDPDEHFWRTSADNLPWVCVYEPNGVYSATAGIYNVQKLPTYYLINRKCEVSANGDTIKDLDEAIRKLL